MAKITIDLNDDIAAYLNLLEPSGVEAALARLAHSAADGIRRPGAWEREWLSQAFPENEFMGRVHKKIQAGEMTKNQWGQFEFVSK